MLTISEDQLRGIGIILFATTTLFSFITLPVEINASKRALVWLSSSGITNSYNPVSYTHLHSPVDKSFKKEKVKGVSAKVITAAILAGDLDVYKRQMMMCLAIV